MPVDVCMAVWISFEEHMLYDSISYMIYAMFSLLKLFTLRIHRNSGYVLLRSVGLRLWVRPYRLGYISDWDVTDILNKLGRMENMQRARIESL